MFEVFEVLFELESYLEEENKVGKLDDFKKCFLG